MTNGDFGRLGLVLGVADGAVFLNDHGPAAIAVTHACSPAVLFREFRLCVRQQQLVGISQWHQVELGMT